MITPNGAWGGDGSLGCGIGYGYLHRIPIDVPAGSIVPPPTERPSMPTSTHAELKVEKSNESEAAASVMPIVPPMMSSPVVGTMPPPPVSAVTTATSPILPPLSTDASRASSASPPHPVPAPPPSTVTSIGNVQLSTSELDSTELLLF